MKILKKSQRTSPKISIILLDWGVRESFHFLHYISKQNIDRNLFEIVIIEYYSNVSKVIEEFADEVDTWALLEMPKDAYYHKHLMYNAGLVMSQGEYVIICDSDAMAKPTFLESVLNEFAKNPNIVLHIDQFRNNRRDLYPFNYPSFEEVTGRGCINYLNGKTTGMAVKEDIIHNRNYGACFCARRDLLIQIGGADEHIDFIGHICGPYDLTFRLINLGCKEIWHETEFLYHTWHPGQAGENNYLGPHDGRHMSTTSLEALYNFRVYPHVENLLIAKLRNGFDISEADLQDKLILPEYVKITKFEFLSSSESREWANATYQYMLHGGYKIISKNGIYYALSRFIKNQDKDIDCVENKAEFRGNSFAKLIKDIDDRSAKILSLTHKITVFYVFASRVKSILKRKLRVYISGFCNKVFEILCKPYKLLRGFYKSISKKYNNTKNEHNYYWENMSSMLHNIKLAYKENKNITLLISAGNESLFLYMARKFKLIPKINILKYNDPSDVKDCLANLNIEVSHIILLSKQLYVDNALYFDGISNDKKYFIV